MRERAESSTRWRRRRSGWNPVYRTEPSTRSSGQTGIFRLILRFLRWRNLVDRSAGVRESRLFRILIGVFGFGRDRFWRIRCRLVGMINRSSGSISGRDDSHTGTKPSRKCRTSRAGQIIALAFLFLSINRNRTPDGLGGTREVVRNNGSTPDSGKKRRRGRTQRGLSSCVEVG